MNHHEKLVIQLPLTTLWTEAADIDAKRGQYVTEATIQEMLQNHPVIFALADIGQKLHWINQEKSFEYWKTEVKPHLAPDLNHIDLDCFPNNYAYIASEWVGAHETPIILLEKYH